jgi:hypothetical protein
MTPVQSFPSATSRLHTENEGTPNVAADNSKLGRSKSGKSEFEELPRHAQILQDVFGEGVPATAWAHFVQTPTELGLACPQAAAELKHRLAALFSEESAARIDDIKHASDQALR